MAALLTLPALRAHGHLLSYQFPSLLQPMLVLLVAATLGLALVAARVARGALRRLWLVALLVTAAAGAVAVALPSARAQVVAGLTGWLLRRDPWIASVAEFQPFGWRRRVRRLCL